MRRISALLLLMLASVGAFAEDKVRYVTDELAIVLRDSPSGEGASRGTLMSGTRLVVLESRPSGYARVRTPDGKEAWIQERYLQDKPIAAARVDRAEKDAAAAQAELKKLKEDHARLLADFARISGGEPIASRELMAETEQLRAQLKKNAEDLAAAKSRYNAERARQRTLLLGAGLVVLGGLLALVLRWLWPKKRWGDF